MLMWTTLLEGPDGLGDFDFVYFAVRRTSRAISASTATTTWRSSSSIFDNRVKTDPGSRRRSKAAHQARVPPLLRAARVVDGEPRRARRVEHLQA
jgi:hypothetical protein